MPVIYEKSTKEDSRLKYFLLNVSKLHPAQQKLRELTYELPTNLMLGTVDTIAILSNMIKFAGAKKCIDVGVYTGYSSLSWALAIPDDGKVVALDISNEYAEVGKPVWKEAGVENKIDLRIGKADESLQQMIDSGESASYDFVFIDADKPGYDKYYELCLQLVRKDGIIALDNCWYTGMVLDDEETDPRPVALRNLNVKIREDSRVTAVLVDCGDGVYVCRKN